MSEETERNIGVVLRGYEAFGRGDLDEVMGFYDDNIEWTQPGRSAISGTYHGKGELAELLRRLGEQTTSVRPLRFFADGDTVVVLSEATVGGETSRDVEVFTMRDGKVLATTTYGDTALMERLYGARQSAVG